MKAIDVLREEHSRIKRVIGCFSEIIRSSHGSAVIDRDDLHKIVLFFNEYADRSHHAKEDEILLPLMQERHVPLKGCSLRDIVIEHNRARALLESMQADLAAWAHDDFAARDRFFEHGAEFNEIMLGHIEREDECLFPAAEQVLTEADNRELLQAFDESDERETGAGTFETLQELVGELCGKWMDSSRCGTSQVSSSV